jgi:hypothetical protein
VKVRMRVGISGTRSGEDWPAPGGTLEVDDEEGMALCAGGLAEPVAEPEKVETAVAPEPEKRDDEADKRGPGRPRKTA